MPKAGRDLVHQTISGLLWTAVGKGGNAGLTLLTLVILARLLSPREFGTVSAALVIIEFSSIFSHLGLGPAVVQRQLLEERHLRAAFAGSLVLGLAIGIAIWWAAPLAAAFFHNPDVEPVLRALAWVFPLRGMSAVADSLMLRELRFRWLANLDLAIYALGHGLVAILLALAGFGVWALVSAALIEGLVRAAILLYMRPPPLGTWPEWRALKELLHFGGGFTLARLANQLALQGDNLVVGHWLGPAALGLYGRAYNLMAAPATLVGKVLDDVLFPTMARVQDDVERLGRAYRRGVAVIALVALPVSAVLFVLAPELIHVTLGPRWHEAVTPFRILATGILFRTSYKLSDSLARSTGVVYRRARRQMVYAGLVLGGAYVGQHWGLGGVAAGVVVALVLNFLLMAQLSLEVCRLDWNTFWEAHVPSVVLTGVCAVSTWTVATILRDGALDALPILLISTGSAAACGVVITWRFPQWCLGADGRWTMEVLSRFFSRPSGRLPTHVVEAKPEESV
jgi:O-antigen/teichoic acid export membrane protein